MARLKMIYNGAKKKITQAFSSNPTFFWTICSLYFITFFILLPWGCNKWAFSSYMSSSWKTRDLDRMVLEQDREKLAEAKKYVAGLDMASTPVFYQDLLAKTDLDIVIAVITVKRTRGTLDVGYLTRVMMRFDQIFKRKDGLKKGIFICNVHAGPGLHKEAELLAEYFPMVSRFPKEDPSAVVMDRFEKEKQDYVYCLQQASEYKPTYAVMVEDDALPRYDMFNVLAYTLNHNIQNRWIRGDQNHNHQQWAYYKLFYPEKWSGYTSEFRKLLELAAISSIGGGIALMLMRICSQERIITRYSNVTDCCAFFLGAFYCFLVAMLVGRQYIIELRRLFPIFYNVVSAPGCCTPSVLYPTHLVPEIISYLNDVQCNPNFAIDKALDKYASIHSYKTHLIEPNIFKHIGYVSTIKGPDHNPVAYFYE